ncbi:MAG: amino acid adenylation domain-containing protein, partial [Cyclobacteriaceae bacterium]
MSYGCILHKANQVTSYLLKLNLNPGSPVAVSSENRAELICTIIGIMNARLAFVVFDSNLPSERLSSMALDMDLGHIIASNDSRNKLEGINLSGVQIHDISELMNLSSKVDPVELPEYGESDDLYVYFTSGSTGTPKGIVGRNKSLLQFIKWEVSEFNFESRRFSQFISPTFDAFLRDVFVPLFCGGTICIPPVSEDFFSSDKLITWLSSTRVNVIHCVPSLFAVFNIESPNIDDFIHLKFVLMSGEKISPADLKTWYNNHGDNIQLVNLYGTTETTMVRTLYRITQDDTQRARIPIGEPIADTEIFIANKQMKPVGMLMPGEVYIVTDYLTNGYLNNPELNSEKFVTLIINGDEKKAFRTGDKARRIPGNKIELIGREDRQIKLRGIRVELDEIENKITEIESVSKAIAYVHDNDGIDTLIAFVTIKSDQDEEQVSEQVKQNLTSRLPDYMIPAQIITLDSFPLLSNGKVNYKELENSIIVERDIIHPTNDIEAGVLGIWKEILGDKEISTDDKFHYIGGNSLTIMSLITKIHRKFEVRIALSHLFKIPTIKEQAAYIAEETHEAQVKIPIAPLSEHYPLSLAQERLFFIYQMDKETLAYNMPQFVKLNGVISVDQLQKAFSGLIERHEILRTSFQMVNSTSTQTIKAISDINVNIEIFENEPFDHVSEKFVRPFDLSEAPLIRVGIHHQSEKEHTLMLDIHHIVSDGVSQNILFRDFMAIFNSDSLPALEIQYKDYAVWQKEPKQLHEITKQEAFWMSKFKEDPVRLDLPSDHVRPVIKNYEGAITSFELKNEEVSGLDNIAKKAGTTRFMVILSIYNILLSKLSNQQDITIGVPVSDRPHESLDGSLGLFVNTVVLRNYPVSDLAFLTFLKDVKDNTLESLDNKDYPYEQLIDLLKVDRDTSRNPLFDVMFSYQNFKEHKFAIEGLETSAIARKKKESKFDLTLFAYDHEDSIWLTFEYATSIFEESTIQRFIAYFNRIAEAVVSNSDLLIKDIEVLSDGEKNRVLNSFNDSGKELHANQTLVSILKKQVSLTPDNIAISFQDNKLTYAELDSWSDKFAAYLQTSYGVKKGSMVAVMLEREKHMVPIIYGILKAGAIYLPLDPNNPVTRLESIAEDADVDLVVSRSSYLSNGATFRQTLNLDQNTDQIVTVSNHCNDVVIGENDVAYVIYTSGTSGKPKGVVIEHKSVVNRLQWMQDTYGLKADDVLIQKTPIVFDVSIWELFWWSFAGASLHIPLPGTEKDPSELVREIQNRKVSTIHFVPSMFDVFLNYILKHDLDKELSSLDQIFVSGEALKVDHLTKFKNSTISHCRLVNLYGPTEATVDVTHFECQSSENYSFIPIGKPIS